jgi:diguanylate cyclase (GGDEF)-like protein
VNDTLGHDVGDILLTRVAERLEAAVRETDTVARLGGDEFAVLVEDIKKEGDLNAPAKRILEALESDIYIGEHALRVTTSIGIAVFPQNGASLEELLRNADSAMYRAKENGRNNYQFFDEEMHQRAVQRMRLEKDLSGALEREEFQIHYQPLHDCRNGRAVSFEALLRWHHPERGTVSPDEFVPLLEDLGQIAPVGEWVLRRACAQLREWQEEFGRELRVAVNVSARQFDDPELVAKVARALRAASLEPSSLELEVTESLVMSDLSAATKTLHRLKDIGVRIAIDDFGTGYSQFVSLVRFPIDVLKIDRSVIDAVNDNEGAKVTKAVIDLGHTLGLEVVAEGVERDSQLEFLREQMCDCFQGYLATRPMTSCDCSEWLAQHMAMTNTSPRARHA